MPAALTSAVGRTFDRAAANYAAAADVQITAARRVAELCASCHLVRAAGILEIGCGTGLLTRQLAARFPQVAITALDVAPGMLREARAACQDQARRITWVAGDLRNWCGSDRYALVASSSVLHWVTPLPLALERIAGLLVPGGWLVGGLMGDGTLTELRRAWQQAVADKPFPVVLPSAAAVADGVRAAGLEPMEIGEERVTAWYLSAETLLRRLHAQGVTGSNVTGRRQLLTRGELRRLTAAYDAGWKVAERGVPATYQLLFVKGQRPSPAKPGPSAASNTHYSLGSNATL